MKQILAIIIVLLWASCKPNIDKKDLEAQVSASITETTGYSLNNIQLIRKEDYLYTGFITLTDNTKAEIEVSVDKDQPTDFLWKVTQPSPTMITDAMNKANAEMQQEWNNYVDSLTQATEL